MAFLDYYSEIKGSFPKCDVFLAQKIVQRAWQDIQQKRLWSFLIKDSALLTSAIVSIGTANVTQYQDAVVMDATASAAINLIPIQTPVTLQQFRVPFGPIYNITGWNPSTNTLTLDRVFAEGSASANQYQIYQCYYAAPGATIIGDTKFRKWLSVFDPINAYWLRLNKSSQDFDHWDPQRGDFSNPYYLGYYKVVNGAKLYELWPHPVEQIGYRCKWLSAYTPFVDDADELPETISDAMLMERAMFYGCGWASKMAGTYRELAGTNWNTEKANHLATYLELLRDAENEDEDTFQTNLIPSSTPEDEGHPNTSQWEQTHDGLYPGELF
jgi:hypothetical protein